MELHHKIVEVLKQEFPDLKVPEIQEGFGAYPSSTRTTTTGTGFDSSTATSYTGT